MIRSLALLLVGFPSIIICLFFSIAPPFIFESVLVVTDLTEDDSTTTSSVFAKGATDIEGLEDVGDDLDLRVDEEEVGLRSSEGATPLDAFAVFFFGGIGVSSALSEERAALRFFPVGDVITSSLMLSS